MPVQQLLQAIREMREDFARDMATLRETSAREIRAVQESQTQAQEASNNQIRVLQDHLAALRTPASTPAPREASPEPEPTIRVPLPEPQVAKAPALPSHKKMILPDPPKFEGVRRKYRTWELEMRGKLRTDGHLMGGPLEHWSYIYSRLGDGPQAMCAAFYQTPHNHADPPTAFFQYLGASYGDQNIARKALDKVGSMTQGDKESFASFLPKFEKELADAGGADWPDVVKIGHLKRTLNESMQAQLRSQLSMPEVYFQYVGALQTLGANLDDAHLRGRKRNTWRSKSPAPAQKTPKQASSTQDSDAMDWEPTKISKAMLRQNKELEGKRAVWVDQKEIERRAKERLCFRCGRRECRVDRCPLKPARRPDAARSEARKARPEVQKAKARKAKAVTVEVASESEAESVEYESCGDSDDESGKE